ncbi:Alkaline ceramidase [Aphelenchoides avenae]|nr:Alkaline ceramidase [Aphelenchus avenae]
MERWFAYESGHAWCESAYKYQTLPFVAEFANTVTNLPIIVLPMVNAMLLRRYITEVNWLIFLPHLLLTINGLASSYYHATINLFGQLVDELSILWLINICVVAYLPTMKWYPAVFRQHISQIRWIIVTLTVMISALCFLKPSINAFALMTFSIPGVCVIYYEGTNAGIPEAEKFTWRVFGLWGLAVTFWISDRLFCDVWLYLGTPYLHAIFHLLSSVAAYNVFVMFSLLDINRRAEAYEHNFTAKVKYFPVNRPGRFSLPYISLNESKVSD